MTARPIQKITPHLWYAKEADIAGLNAFEG
jgi:hypothetical protein